MQLMIKLFNLLRQTISPILFYMIWVSSHSDWLGCFSFSFILDIFSGLMRGKIVPLLKLMSTFMSLAILHLIDYKVIIYVTVDTSEGFDTPIFCC